MLVVVALGAAVFFGGRFLMRMSDDGQPSGAPSSQPVSEAPSVAAASPTPVALDQVQVGQCIPDAIGMDGLIDSLPVVPCDVPHNGEVYAVTDSGVLSDQNFNNSYCQTEFAHYMDSVPGQSRYTFAYVYPAEAGNNPHLTLICIVYSASGATNTGSLEGSGR